MSQHVLMTPRESMAAPPEFVQPFLTWLTGMPLAGQSPKFLWSPWRLIACVLGEIATGLLTGVVAFYAPWWAGILLLPISWLLTTGGVRMFFVVIEHSCTHHFFGPKDATNRIVAEAVSILLWTQAYTEFKHEHATHHRVTRLAEDPDTRFLKEWGFYAGMSHDAVLIQLLRTALSPVYHIKTFAERIESSFSGPLLKVLMAAAYACSLFCLLSVLDIWPYWLALWAFPVVVLFQISMVINILTEHRWPLQQSSGRRDLAEVCFGRFCGESVPTTDGIALARRLWLWSVWWGRVAVVYLPYRLFVLVGDEPQHDLHHRQPTSDWANAKFARFAQASNGKSDKHGEYTDEWGSLLDHIHASAGPRRPKDINAFPQELDPHTQTR